MEVGYTLLAINFVYVSIIGTLFFIKKKVDNIETKIFSVSVVSCLLGLIIEFFSGITIIYLGADNLLTLIINKLHIANISLWITVFTTYIVTLCFSENEKFKTIDKRKIGWTLFLFTIMITLISFFLPIEFYSDEKYIYSDGVAPNFTMILGVIYLIIDAIAITTNIKKIEKLKLLPLIILVLGFGIVITVRAINPGLVLITTIFSLVTVLMYNTIENPDVKMIEQLDMAKS